jgi:hypothetical protein
MLGFFQSKYTSQKEFRNYRSAASNWNLSTTERRQNLRILPQVIILSRPHLLLLGFGLITISTQMKYPMKNNPEHFFFESKSQVSGIFNNPVNGDIDFPCHGLALFGQVESDDIGKIIMSQILVVHLEQELVGTKNIMYRPQPDLFAPEDAGNEIL